MKDKRRSLRRGLLLIPIAVLAGFWIYAAVGNGGSTSTKIAGKHIREDIQKILSRDDNKVKSFVEDAHRTVTVRSLKVAKCEILTSDGSTELNEDLSNLNRVDITLLVKWDGWFHKGGETTVAYSLLPDGNGGIQTTPFKVVSTTARYTKDSCK